MSRRLVDLVVATVALMLLAPLLLGVAVAIAATMGRPVLFRQLRAGRDGVPFRIVKFRTMRPERYAGEPDPDRTTRLGRWLRASSVDELPQLWNVLWGDMSLIGPRPTLLDQVVRYGPRERGRLAVRPGLTGYAQVSGRNHLSWPERIELDLWYLAHRSPALDLRIVARSVAMVVRGEGVTAPGGINPGYPSPDDAATARPGGSPSGTDPAPSTAASRAARASSSEPTVSR